MPQLKLTKTNIDTKAVPDTSPKLNDILYWDTEKKGFGLRVTPKGKKVFIAQGRVKGSDAPAARFTIGQYGPFTVDQARDEADNVLRSLRQKVDPREVAKEERAARERAKLQQVTLREAAEAHMRDNSRRKVPLKQSSRDTIERHLNATFRAWQHLPIFSITRDMVRDRYNEMLEGGLSGEREGGSPGQANQAFQILRAIFYYAMDEYRDEYDEPLLKKNPVTDTIKKWQQLGSREDRRVPQNKVGVIWHALTTARDATVNKYERVSIDLVMLLTLTGFRFSEAAAMTWDRLKLLEDGSGTWHLPDPKSRRAVTLPLSTQAVVLLKLRQKERDDDSQFVFPSWGKHGHMVDPRGAFIKVSELAGLKISAHDLRRTFLDVGNDYCGIDMLKIKLLMQHSIKKDVTHDHYARISKPQNLTPAIQAIGDWIEREGLIAKDKAEGGNVRTMPQRA